MGRSQVTVLVCSVKGHSRPTLGDARPNSCKHVISHDTHVWRHNVSDHHYHRMHGLLHTNPPNKILNIRLLRWWTIFKFRIQSKQSHAKTDMHLSDSETIRGAWSAAHFVQLPDFCLLELSVVVSSFPLLRFLFFLLLILFKLLFLSDLFYYLLSYETFFFFAFLLL